MRKRGLENYSIESGFKFGFSCRKSLFFLERIEKVRTFATRKRNKNEFDFRHTSRGDE